MAIRDLKAENSQYTVPVLIGKLRALDIIGSYDEISRPTIYRFLAKEEMGRTSPDAVDRRRFEADHSNEIWQCDILHGPKVFGSDGKVRKSYLLAIMDDHSRMTIHARFYESESFETLKTALRESGDRRLIGVSQSKTVIKRSEKETSNENSSVCYQSRNPPQRNPASH
jgi:transposase InsO family protein